MVTVVVARIANAGELAGRLEPEVLRALFDRYGDRVRSAVDRHGGVARVESGRAIAVFGVPVVREDDALRAVRAAAELRDGIGVLNDGLLPEHGVFLEVRTAIDTGEVLVTQAEGELATGRPVTAADELERSARPGQILLGEPAHALVRELVEVEAVSPGVHRLVGLLPDVHGRALRLDSPLVGRRRQLQRCRAHSRGRDGARAPPVHRARSRRRRKVAARAGVRRERGECRNPAPRAVPPVRRDASRTGRSAHSSPPRATRRPR